MTWKECGACRRKKVVGELYAGKPHVQFDEGALETCGQRVVARLRSTLLWATPAFNPAQKAHVARGSTLGRDAGDRRGAPSRCGAGSFLSYPDFAITLGIQAFAGAGAPWYKPW